MEIPFLSRLRPFIAQYTCFSIRAALGRRIELDERDRVLLPPSALDELTRRNVDFPMYFKIRNKGLFTHCGVMEFTAPEGFCYVPSWIMQNNLGGLEEGRSVTIENVTLPVATFTRFQPLTSDFLNIYDHKAVLESNLRTLSCLTENDFVIIKYNQKEYSLRILQCEPSRAVSIIDCDMSVDFAEPIVKDNLFKDQEDEEEKATDETETMPFSDAFQGVGYRLGRPGDVGQAEATICSNGESNRQSLTKRGIPDLNHKIGTLKFDRTKKKPKKPKPQKDSGPFQGEGRTTSNV
ncbi:hypothetical protein ACOME3_007183 [Neoechinorhynchus agilis]